MGAKPRIRDKTATQFQVGGNWYHRRLAEEVGLPFDALRVGDDAGFLLDASRFTLSGARRLASLRIDAMGTRAELIKHIARVSAFVRKIRTRDPEIVTAGYYRLALAGLVAGPVPRYPWLLHNLEVSRDEAVRRLQKDGG